MGTHLVRESLLFYSVNLFVLLVKAVSLIMWIVFFVSMKCNLLPIFTVKMLPFNWSWNAIERKWKWVQRFLELVSISKKIVHKIETLLQIESLNWRIYVGGTVKDTPMCLMRLFLKNLDLSGTLIQYAVLT